jgi:deoxycytidylate deaminase
MSRQRRFRDMASIQALKSTANYKHGALVVKGNRVYSRGFNNPRNKFLNKYDCCQHAEMNAVTKFINNHVRKNTNKYSLWRNGKTKRYV